MYTHLRKMCIPVARDLMFKIMHKINAEGIKARHKGQINHKRKFKTPGLNWTLSLDGHHKFCAFGIDVYVAVYIYSRCIISVHVIIAAGTAVSVFSPVICAVKKTGVRMNRPRI